MPEGKTIGQLMEEMRQKAGAQNYHGHDYMDLQRFAENTRHMIIFDVLTHDSPVGWKGERTRLFLSDKGYEKALDSQAKGQIKILSHAKVRNGDLLYDRSEQIRWGRFDEEIPSPAAGGPALEINAPPLHILWKGGDENAGRSGKQDFNAGCQRNKVHRQAAQSRHQQVPCPPQGKEAAKAEKP